MPRLIILLGLLSWFGVPVSLGAKQESHTKATLLTEVSAIEPGKPFAVGVRLQMEPGWHTYWINPGDSGLATTIQWTLPPGFSAGPIQWPTPHRISTPPLMSYGYEGEVLLVSTIQPPADLKPGTKVEIAAAVDWLECQDICLPGGAKLKVTLPVVKDKATSSSAETRILFVKAFVNSPAALRVGLDIDKVEAQANLKTVRLAVTGKAPWPMETKAYFFADKTEVVESAAPQVVTFQDGGTKLVLTLTRPASAPALETLSGVLEVNGRAASISIPVQLLPVAEMASASSGGTFTLGLSLVFAFLGGLILNLMPCVLPVLSLKVLSLVRQAGEDHRAAWKQGVAFTLGVLVSFWVLAGILLVLRAAGQQLGWGFQMQSPLFIFALTVLFFVFALNLFGIFEIGASLVGVDSGAAQRGGVAGSFGMGALATIAATPCTAPFMGAALGFAVAQSPATAVLVFTFLALGMASPYLVLALFPSLLRYVPKPGAWMESFKQFLGFLLLGTVIFLLWVFGQQVNMDAVAQVNGALLLIALGAWIYGRWGNLSRSASARSLALIAGAICLLMAIAWGVGATSQPMAVAGREGTRWEPYSAERLAALRAEGKPVFLDFTAAWCLSCKVNEAVALNTVEVQRKFTSSGVVLMKADWTRRDAAITQALAAFGRNGVPLYVLYGRDPNTAPQILPEVLTPGIVLQALDNLK